MRVRAAAVIIKDDAVLLVEHCKRGRSYWLLPGGGVRAGETVADALARELIEEVNLEPAGGDFLFVVETISSEGVRVLQPTYRVDTRRIDAIRLGDDKRVTDYGFFPPDVIASLTLYPDIAGELSGYVRGRSLTTRYIYKKWLD